MSFDGSFESMGQKQQAAWKKFGNPVFGPASNLAVAHEIILGGVYLGIALTVVEVALNLAFFGFLAG